MTDSAVPDLPLSSGLTAFLDAQLAALQANILCCPWSSAQLRADRLSRRPARRPVLDDARGDRGDRHARGAAARL